MAKSWLYQYLRLATGAISWAYVEIERLRAENGRLRSNCIILAEQLADKKGENL